VRVDRVRDSAGAFEAVLRKILISGRPFSAAAASGYLFEI